MICALRHYQLWLYGHVTRCREPGLAQRAVSVRFHCVEGSRGAYKAQGLNKSIDIVEGFALSTRKGTHGNLLTGYAAQDAAACVSGVTECEAVCAHDAAGSFRPLRHSEPVLHGCRPVVKQTCWEMWKQIIKKRIFL